MYISGLIILFNIAVLSIFGLVYIHFTINTYNIILLFLILVIIISTVLLILSTAAVFNAYKNKKISKHFMWFVKSALKTVFPAAVFVSTLAGVEKDAVRKLFVEINNIAVESTGLKYRAENILILLPHCLQNSGCAIKVTNDVNNCKRCGNCSIGDVLKIADRSGVPVIVVTGGTAARNVIGRDKPGVILSVACERDLSSGIADVGSIPVMGIINERPNGPCRDTALNIVELEEKLNSLLSV